jgi:hypothetical protein
MTNRTTRSVFLLTTALIILISAAVRLYRLNAIPLRGDEAFTVLNWMRQPLSQTIDEITTVDPQPPFNYALYRAYALLVSAQADHVRFLPVLFSTAGVALMIALGTRLGGRTAGLTAGLLWAISPVALWHAQDARSYAIWMTIHPAAVWLALRALERGRRIDWVLMIAAGVLALYTYYLELFPVAALNLYVLFVYRKRRDLLMRWFVAQAVIAVCAAPWYLQERLLSGGGYGGTTLRFDPTWLVETFIPTLVFGEFIPQEWLRLLALGIFIIPLLALAVFRSRRWLLLLLLVVVPVIAISLVSTRLNVFAPRYVLSVSIAVVLSCALLLSRMQDRSLRLGSSVLFVVIHLFLITGYFFDYAKSPDWRALTSYLAQRIRPTDAIIQSAADEAFTLYCLDAHLTDDCDHKLPANPSQSVEEIHSRFSMTTRNQSAVWLVARPPSGWQNSAVPLDWLHDRMQPIRDTAIGGLPVHHFMPWEVQPNELASQPIAVFDGTAILSGIDAILEPDSTLLITLIWQPIAHTDAPLKIFVHLLDAHGALVSQDDQPPQDGRLSAQTWLIDVPLRDVYLLPLSPDLAAQIQQKPGDFTIAAGLYDPETTRRILMEDGTDAAFIPLAPLLAP